MRIIGPPHYKPEVTCLQPPWDAGEILYKKRKTEERRNRLRVAREHREARLRCPECGDSMKVRLYRRWFCRHCLMEMTLGGRLRYGRACRRKGDFVGRGGASVERSAPRPPP